MRVSSSILLFLLFLSIAASIVYTPVTKVDLNDAAIGDTQLYIAMYEGQSLKEIPKPFRYRFLVPYLARMIPSPPASLLVGFEIDSSKIVKYKFGVVNALGLALAAWVLFFFSLKLGFDRPLSIIGSLLFLTSFYILAYAGLPFADAIAYLFLITSIYAIFTDRDWLLLPIFAIGIFAKETIVLALFIIFIQDKNITQKIKKIVMCLPGIFAYLLVRMIVLPTSVGYNYTYERFLDTFKVYQNSFAPWVFAVINILFVFGFIWIFAIKGFQIAWRSKRRAILDLAVIVPVVLLVPFIIGSDLGRIWFLGFPAIIPLSLLGIEYFIFQPTSVSAQAPGCKK